MFKKHLLIKFALVSAFLFSLSSAVAQENLIRAESYAVSQPAKDSMWYICKSNGNKAGKILKGPFANKESAIANWYYISASPSKSCIAENLKFITNNPERDFPLEYKTVREELELNHTAALKKYSVPVNTKYEKKFLKRSTVKSDEKIYEIDLYSISKKTVFKNEKTANYTALFQLKVGKKEKLNKGDVVILKWKGKLSSSVSQLFLNFQNKTEAVNTDIEADNIFEGYKAFKLEEDVSGKIIINMYYLPEDCGDSAVFELVQRDDKIVVDLNNLNGEKKEEPEEVESVEDEVEVVDEVVEDEPHFEFVPEDENTANLKRFRKEFLQDYAVDDVFIVPEEEKKPSIVANPNEKDEKGRTQLMTAAAVGNEWQVRSLLESGAKVNVQDLDGWTALMYAARYSESLSTIELLIENGADIKLENKFESSALLIAVCYNNNPNVIAKLLEGYESTDKEVLKAFVFLLSSTFPSDYVQKAKFQIFIEKDVPVNSFYNGKTPLMYAAQFSNSTQLIKMLIENDAIKTVRSTEGKTAFDYAKNNSKLKHDDVYWSLNSK